MKRGNYYLWSVRGAELSLLKIHNDATTYPPPLPLPRGQQNVNTSQQQSQINNQNDNSLQTNTAQAVKRAEDILGKVTKKAAAKDLLP